MMTGQSGLILHCRRVGVLLLGVQALALVVKRRWSSVGLVQVDYTAQQVVELFVKLVSLFVFFDHVLQVRGLQLRL